MPDYPVRYQEQHYHLAQQQRERIEHIDQVTQSSQRELGRIHTEGARMAIETLTVTRERIQTAAANGMSGERVAALVEQQKEYLRSMQHIVNQGAAGLQSVVSNLPALPGRSR